MDSNCQPTLKVVRTLLSGPGGPEAARSLLERRTREHTDVYNSAIVWACLSDLRRKTGDESGAQEAAERASMLRTAPVRTLSFNDADSLPERPQSFDARRELRFSSPVMERYVDKHELPMRDAASVRDDGVVAERCKGSGKLSDVRGDEASARRRDLRERCRKLLAEAGADLSSFRSEGGDALPSRERLLFRRSQFLRRRTAALLQIQSERDRDAVMDGLQ